MPLRPGVLRELFDETAPQDGVLGSLNQLLTIASRAAALTLLDGAAARPGRTHDITVARHDHVLAHLRAAGLGALADLGFRGLDNDVRDPVVVTGFTATRVHKLTPGQKTANRVLATGRAPVEHGFTHLKNWRILTKLRTDPARANARSLI
ncbi:transposase family protein [Streptomyces sp. NPDC088246]|uniref:transposase family protein n=1 Tax=Streptomyces sp. NPDC088246 TaxID=3365842 RepID=UPI00380B5478